MKKITDNPILTVVKAAQPVTDKGQVDKFAERRVGDFVISHGQIYFMRRGRDHKDGQVIELPTALTDNFVALIAEQIILDDGIKQETAFVLEGKQKTGQLLPTLTIPATQYIIIQWALKHWGARAIIEPDQASARRLAVGILKLSVDIPITTVYQHTGWREINKQWYYLSGSGAIGKDGLNTEIRVELGECHLQRYALPAPVEDQRQVATLFSLLHIAPNNPAVGVTLFCCVIRAAVSECLPSDFATLLAGQSGAQKSECGALVLAFFGDFNARTFPANFSDTESDLEHKAHQCKDAVFVVDDFVPSTSQVETNKLHAKAERLFRGAGNQSGRGRCNTDMSSKAAYFPRGLIVATGEDLPKGASLLSRLLVIELKRGDVDLSALSGLQVLARRGELAAIMAAFLKWLAPRMPELKRTFPDKVRDIRHDALQEKFASSHPRAPDIYASLFAAANVFIDFAQEAGAITNLAAEEHANNIDNALKAAIQAQSQYQKQSDEVERFIALLRACFSAGECHVGDHLNQGPPQLHPFVWGWRAPSQDADISGCGQRIGWINQPKSELWLEPEATFKAIQRFASSQNEPMLMQKSTLCKRLLERGILATHEDDKKSGRKRPDTKRGVSGKQTRVLVFHTTLITECGDD